MGKKDKLVKRFKSRPKDFTWSELKTLLESLGYQEVTGGKTGGSRRRFIHKECGIIILHKPHPGKILKMYQIDQVKAVLEKEELI